MSYLIKLNQYFCINLQLYHYFIFNSVLISLGYLLMEHEMNKNLAFSKLVELVVIYFMDLYYFL